MMRISLITLNRLISKLQINQITKLFRRYRNFNLERQSKHNRFREFKNQLNILKVLEDLEHKYIKEELAPELSEEAKLVVEQSEEV